jgi:glycosyltransferase involved in cell wall biosynthesis
VKVLVIAEYYPRAGDRVLGVWAHRQAVAARDAGAEVRVLVLHRPIAPLSALRALDLRAVAAAVRQPRRAVIDGIEIDYLRYLSPPRPWSYQQWGAWAAPVLARALARIHRPFPFELIHAHYAVPAGDAVRRAVPSPPLVVSVHGHDVQGAGAGGRNVRRTLAHARLVLANSAGTATRSRALGARATRVVHLGTDVPSEPTPRPPAPTLVTVAHLGARKRHADVIAALARLRAGCPELRYVIVGDGPERPRLSALARSLGVADAVDFRGQLPPGPAVAAARAGTLFVLPSVDEAFGVAYVEAMAGGVPAIGCRGEDGPEEIASVGGGIALVPPRDPGALADEIGELLRDPARLEALGRQARSTVEREFTWTGCGRATLAAYGEALSRAPASEHER